MARAARRVASAIRRRVGPTGPTDFAGPTGPGLRGPAGLTPPTGRAAGAVVSARFVPAGPAACAVVWARFLPAGPAACAVVWARFVPAGPAAGADAPGRSRSARATVAAAGPVTTGRRDQLTDFADRVLDVVDAIPPGQVMSYGDIAEYLGQGGPRQVGRVMALWGGGVAWWRVIHADGPSCPAMSAKRSPITGRKGRPCGAAGCGWTCGRPAARSASAPAGTHPADRGRGCVHMLDIRQRLITDLGRPNQGKPDKIMTEIRDKSGTRA